LICTPPEFDALAQEVSSALAQLEMIRGITDPAALVAPRYGRTETEFAHILTTFPLVDERMKQQMLKTYRDRLRLGKLPDSRL
jgi:hypothetical protein